MDVGSTSLPAYKTPNKLEEKFKSDELFMLVVAHICLFTSFRSQTKSGGTLAVKKKKKQLQTHLGTLIASFIPVNFAVWLYENFFSESLDCVCNGSCESLSIDVAHGQVHHPAVAPHPSCHKYTSLWWEMLLRLRTTADRVSILQEIPRTVHMKSPGKEGHTWMHWEEIGQHPNLRGQWVVAWPLKSSKNLKTAKKN